MDQNHARDRLNYFAFSRSENFRSHVFFTLFSRQALAALHYSAVIQSLSGKQVGNEGDLIMSTLKYKSRAALAAILASFVFGNAAFAQNGEEVRTEIVQYGDLNLQNAEGVATLDLRLSRAITRVCRDNGTNTISSRRAARRCEHKAKREVKSARNFAIAQANSARTQFAEAGPNR